MQVAKLDYSSMEDQLAKVQASFDNIQIQNLEKVTTSEDSIQRNKKGFLERVFSRKTPDTSYLAVRIIGEVTPDKVAMLQHADAIVREELKRAGLERSIWQSFAVLPDIRSVGVMGDERTYAHPVIVRAVTSEDAMTADWARLPYEVMETMSSRIINEVAGINRVAYDITSKPPGTIEWE
jgi:GMP synthase (glutamine-hydrolysing)